MTAARVVPLLFLAAAVAAFLAAAPLLPTRDGGTDGEERALVVCVVDVSASERRVRPNWLGWSRRTLRAEAERALARDAEFAVVLAARDVAVVPGSRDPAAWLDRLDGRGGEAWTPVAADLDDGASDLARGLEVARGLAHDAAPDALRVVLLSSGGTTGADPAEPWARLAREGAELVHARPPAPAWPDLAVESVELPAELEPGAPCAARVTLSLRGDAAAVEELSLLLEVRQGGALLPRVESLAARPGRWTTTVPLGDVGFGALEVRATGRVVTADGVGDPVPENDGAAARAYVEGGRTVGLVRRATDAERARAWLLPGGESAFAGLDLRPLAPAELAPSLDDLDAVVTFDVEPRELPLELFVPWLERGGGWLATSGTRAFFGLDARPELARALPLERLRPRHPERDVLLLVDGSGSMEGAAFEMVRRAAVELAEAALESDAVDLRFFTTVLERAVRVKDRGATGDVGAEAARRLLAARVPGRSTYIAESLLALARERAGETRPMLALLLSDGFERGNHPDLERRREAVISGFAATATRLVAIAVGDDPDAAYLAGFLPEGDDVLFARGLDDLRRIFEYKIADERLRVAEPAVRVVAAPAPEGSLAAGVAVAPESLGSLRRLWRTRVRGDAEAVWTTTDGDPVLALARVGAGRVGQFASHPREGWAPGWVGRAGAGEPRAFGPTLRWLARRPRERTRPALERASDGALELLAGDVELPDVLEAEAAPVDGEALGRVRFVRTTSPVGLDRSRRRRAEALPTAWWDAARGRTLVLRFGEPVGALVLDAPEVAEFVHGPEFAGAATEAGTTAVARLRRSRPPRAGRAGPLLVLGAAALALAGLALGVLSKGRSSRDRGGNPRQGSRGVGR